MNRIGKWLERNIDKFYENDPSKSADENAFEKRKTYDRLWVQAEAIINKRQYRFTDHNKDSLKKNLDPDFDYYHKSTFLDSKIEQDIQFFKNNYTEKRKELYDLRK